MTLSKPQSLTDWPDSQVDRFWTDYRAWSKQYPEIAKTGVARVALIYRLVADEFLAPLNAEPAVEPVTITCLSCGSPRKRIAYTTARRGEVTEWRCPNRGKHPASR